jgi:hypothetical protein
MLTQPETVPLPENAAKVLRAQVYPAISDEKIWKNSPKPVAPKLPFRTALQIAQETPDRVEWVAKPYVALGCITEATGQVKLAGKTTLITHLGRKVLDGLLFMGEITMKTPIVYLTEQPASSWRSTLEKAGLLDREDFHCLYYKDVRGIAWSALAEDVHAYCRSVGAKLLVVDTLSQFAGVAGDSENNAGDALMAMGPLQEIAGNGIAVIVIRHDRKSGGQVGQSGRGSSAYSGAADIVMSIRRPEGNTRKSLRVIHAIGRFEEIPEELTVDLTPDGYVSMGATGNAVQAEAERVLVAALAERGAMSLGELVRVSGLTRTTTYRTLKSLCVQGSVQTTGARRSLRYSLPEQSAGTGEGD